MSDQKDLAAMGQQERRREHWVVVIEVTAESSGESFDPGAVEDLFNRLHDWDAAGLYSSDRYAVALHIAAAAPLEALRCAIRRHDEVARAVDLAKSSLSRVEVLTLPEYELGLIGAPQSATPSTHLPSGLISEHLYTATRSLLRVSSSAEITDLLVRFVIAVGGSVRVGEWRPVPGLVSVDISVESGQQLHAVAETVSMAGMLIERALPPLVEDARIALRQRIRARR